jgi:hypothetical protein
MGIWRNGIIKILQRLVYVWKLTNRRKNLLLITKIVCQNRFGKMRLFII